MRASRLVPAIACVVLALAVCAPVVSADVMPEPAEPQTAEPAGPGTYDDGAAGGEETPSALRDLAAYLLQLAVGFGALFVLPLVGTVLVEAPLIAIAGRGKARAWKVGILVNTLTNPAAVLAVFIAGAIPLLYVADPDWMLLVVAVVEIAVVIVEWRVFKRVLGWTDRRALITSVVANASSFAIGGLLVAGVIPVL